jgi:hypothetical protein
MLRGIPLLSHPAVLPVRNTIPCISNASVVVAFLQGVRDEKMLEKLITHGIHDVFALFSLVDKCVRAAEGRAWHSPVTYAAKEESVTSPPLKRMVSLNQDHYGVPLPK